MQLNKIQQRTLKFSQCLLRFEFGHLPNVPLTRAKASIRSENDFILKLNPAIELDIVVPTCEVHLPIDQ